MKHKSFRIQNFKGIRDISLDFDARPQGNVHTLVGLNESGKTTILEALNFLSYKSENLDPLDLPGYAVKDVHELIPISQRANFNDKIVIEAVYILDAVDNESIREHCKSELKIQLTEDIDQVRVQQTYEFTNSQVIGSRPRIMWFFSALGKPTSRKAQPRKLNELQRRSILGHMENLIPSVLYFPNFLFEFPDRIYLETPPSDPNKHEFYRTILQDVLDAIGDNTNLETHVLARAKSSSRFDKQALSSVLLKMGANISSTVFRAWDRIVKSKIGNKEIVVNCDQDEGGVWYLEFRLKDGNELYSISERSLGFRWFFVFLLLTQYRGFRKEGARNILFLFDEPASNLHPSAQSQLLGSFANFPPTSSIIYTTHSHHMINPKWLEGTFVVRNEGLDYGTDADHYTARNTIITLERYRSFAGRHPDQTTYFQPVLDVLDYRPGELENVPNVVMVEGKNDYYTLKYMWERVLGQSGTMHLLPGGGAGTLEPVIRLYLAWGREFIVLLDADGEGQKQKRRYESEFGPLVRDRIYSLADIEPQWTKLGMERLFEDGDALSIQRMCYQSAQKFNKTHFARAIQELYLTNPPTLLQSATVANFLKIRQFCQNRLGL